MDDEIRFVDILGVLVRHRVEFVVVGGVAAILEGVPIATFDVDVVPCRTTDNNARLLAALVEVNAQYRDPIGRRILPDLEKLESFRLHLLNTDFGKLDLLTKIGDGLTYDELLTRSSEYELDGMKLRVLNLEVIIEAKEIADRPKDRAVLPILRRTLELKRAR